MAAPPPPQEKKDIIKCALLLGIWAVATVFIRNYIIFAASIKAHVYHLPLLIIVCFNFNSSLLMVDLGGMAGSWLSIVFKPTAYYITFLILVFF